MATRLRIPITAITVFGTSSLLVLSVAIVIYLGFGQAVQTTQKLWADQANTLINGMEQSLDSRLQPIREQALWVAQNVTDLSAPQNLDDYMFGSLAATPLVTGIAIITPDGNSRRWHRQHLDVVQADWSDKFWMEAYLQQVKAADGPAWREPIFTDTVGTTTLLHDIPLKNGDGEFIGIFAQIVAINDFSNFIAKRFSNTGVTPFVLYNRDYVLAHPAIITGNERQPLTKLDELGDLVLARIWTPDEDAAFISGELQHTQASGLFWGDDYYLYLYRDIKRYGPVDWTIGAYLNTTLISDDVTERALEALAVGLIVLAFAVIASVVLGRKVSSPVQAIVKAAEAVDAGKLDEIDDLSGSHISELDDASSAFNHMVKGLRERQLIRDTLGRFVPERVANSLLEGEGVIPVQQTEATILFCDIEAFTQLTETLGPVKIVEVLNAYFSDMVEILENHNGVVTQFQGDAILATFNVPITDSDHAKNAISAALEMLRCVGSNRYEAEQLNIRIGINTGPVVAGAIGAKGRLNYTVHGDAVNLAARLEALNKDYGSRLLISASSAAGASGFEFKRLGETTVRGQTTSIEVFTLSVET